MTILDEKKIRDGEEDDSVVLDQSEKEGLVKKYRKGQKGWKLLMDPKSLKMVESDPVRSKTDKKVIECEHTLSLDSDSMNSGYTVLSHTLTVKMDKKERVYQKAYSVCMNGISSEQKEWKQSWTEDLGQSNSQRRSKSSQRPGQSCSSPWEEVIRQITLLEQEVPEYFQGESAMKTQVVTEEEILQTTTCTLNDIYEDIEG